MALRATVLVVALLLVACLAGAAPAPTRPTEAEVTAVAAQLRCVVCQSLSVADSPSEMAAQIDRKSTRLNSSHIQKSRMPSSA